MGTTCRNCLSVFDDSYGYCPHCSQKAKIHRLNLHDVAHEGWHYFTHADKSILSLLRSLTVRTGEVAKEYCEGMRKRHFSPLTFCLLVATLSIIVINLDGGKAMISMVDETMGIHSGELNGTMSRFSARMRNLMAFSVTYYKVFFLATIPLTTFFYWLLLKNERYNFTEHLVANMYMQGYMTLVMLVMHLVMLATGMTGTWVYLIFNVLQFAYYSNFYYRFMGYSSRSEAVRAAVVSFAAISLIFLISIIGMIVYCFA